MIRAGVRELLVAAAVAWMAGIVYGYSTGGSGLGPLTLGYKGAVGDHTGFAILLGVASASLLLGVVLFFVLDRRVAIEAQPVALPLASTAELTPSYWPATSALVLLLLVLGLVLDPLFAVFGTVLALATVLGWLEVVRREQQVAGHARHPVVTDLLTGGVGTSPVRRRTLQVAPLVLLGAGVLSMLAGLFGDVLGGLPDGVLAYVGALFVALGIVLKAGADWALELEDKAVSATA